MLTERDAPAVYLAGGLLAALGAGTLATGVALLAQPGWSPEAYAAVFGAACGAPVVLAFAVMMAALWRRVQAEAYSQMVHADAQLAKAQAQTPPAPAPPAVLRPIPGIINGQRVESRFELHDTKPLKWLAWNAAAWQLVEWYELRRSLTADSLCPGAFADRSAWVRMTDVMRDAGLLIKDRSGTTWRYPLGAVRAHLERGVLDWPDTDPPRIAPCPTAPVTLDHASTRTQT